MKSFFLCLLLICAGTSLQAQFVEITMSRKNASSGGDGSTVYAGQRIGYTISIKNVSGATLTNAKLYMKTVFSTKYDLNSTRVNSVLIADVANDNPFGALDGALISTGTIANGATVTIYNQFISLANVGSFAGSVVFTATKGTTTYYQQATSESTLYPPYGFTDLFSTNTTTALLSSTFSVVKSLSTSDGKFYNNYYFGAAGKCKNAITGDSLPNGSLLTNCNAIAYDNSRGRLYFVQNTSNADLGYVDILTSTNNNNYASARTFVNYKLEPSDTASGKKINKMTYTMTDTGYALTADNQDLISFTISSTTNLPVITQLGPLSNDPNNGTYDVLSETDGDIFSDGYRQLFLLPNSGNFYRINPQTRIATYLGTISNGPTTNSIMGAALDSSGNLYLAGYYPTTNNNINGCIVYKVDMTNLTATPITTPVNSLFAYKTGDFASTNMPALGGDLSATQDWSDGFGGIIVGAGNPVTITIEIQNNGNIPNPGVKLYNPIPTTGQYMQGTTKINGVAVADINGEMPFSISGGQLINTAAEVPGLLKAGAANKVVITFIIQTQAWTTTCNQPEISFTNNTGGTSTIRPGTPLLTTGTKKAICFNTESCICGTLAATLNEDNNSVLTWSIAQKADIDHYELEYANNTSAFSKIDITESQDSLVDKINTNPGTRNYRLKIVSTNGTIGYSNIVQLNIKGIAQLQPNPFEQTLRLQIQLAKTEKVQVRLTDINGKVVYTHAQQLNGGNNNISLTIPTTLSNGIYFAEVLAGNTRILQKKLLK